MAMILYHKNCLKLYIDVCFICIWFASLKNHLAKQIVLLEKELEIITFPAEMDKKILRLHFLQKRLRIVIA